MFVRVKWHLFLFVLAGFVFLYLTLHNLPSSNERSSETKISFPAVNVTDDGASPCEFQPYEPEVMDWDTSRVLRGSPTELFRDNLRDDTRYLTTCAAAGFTNQFMTYVNLVYLAGLSGRVPIIPPFTPSAHISQAAGTLPFGRIFNLTLLRNDLRQPILEWSDVKHIPSTSVQNPPKSEREALGCWSTRPEHDPQPLRVNPLLNNLRLDVSYTRVPTSTRHNPSNPRDDFVIFSKLVPYIFSHSPRRDSFKFMSPSPLGHSLPPDEHLSCFDHLYFTTSSDRLFEWEMPWSPAWHLVGKHIRFNNELVEITKGYISKAFNLSVEDIPPFIAIHSRRGDFANICTDHREPSCLNPLSTFAEKVEQIRTNLLLKHNVNVTHVLIASNEGDPAFWSEVQAYGWFYFNHTEEQTLEKLGEWYLPIVDIVSQSLAIGFVGTVHSTFSLLSARRVDEWNNGSAIYVERT